MALKPWVGATQGFFYAPYELMKSTKYLYKRK